MYSVTHWAVLLLENTVLHVRIRRVFHLYFGVRTNFWTLADLHHECKVSLVVCKNSWTSIAGHWTSRFQRCLASHLKKASSLLGTEAFQMRGIQFHLTSRKLEKSDLFAIYCHPGNPLERQNVR